MSRSSSALNRTAQVQIRPRHQPRARHRHGALRLGCVGGIPAPTDALPRGTRLLLEDVGPDEFCRQTRTPSAVSGRRSSWSWRQRRCQRRRRRRTGIARDGRRRLGRPRVRRRSRTDEGLAAEEHGSEGDAGEDERSSHGSFRGRSGHLVQRGSPADSPRSRSPAVRWWRPRLFVARGDGGTTWRNG